jgi:hypothetical protein
MEDEGDVYEEEVDEGEVDQEVDEGVDKTGSSQLSISPSL